MADLDRVTIRQIRYFAAVADAGSFRRAADRLDITQPTLTAQISALEDALEAQLFERTRSGTWPSATGRELLPTARRVIEEVQGFCDHAASLAGGSAATYRMGVTPTLGPYLLPHILPGIHADYAGLKLYVREAPPRDLENELKNAQQDVILTTEPILSRELTVEPLFHEPLKLAISREHPLARKSRINRSDLRGEEVLTRMRRARICGRSTKAPVSTRSAIWSSWAWVWPSCRRCTSNRKSAAATRCVSPMSRAST